MGDNTFSTPPILGRFSWTTRLKAIPNGQIIFYRNDLPTDAFIIRSGVIKLYDIDDNGNEKILHLITSPAVIPFSFFSSQGHPLQWFYATLTDCELYEISFSKLRSMMQEDAKLNDSLVAALSENVHELLARLSSLAKTHAEDKVVAVLKFLAVRHATKLRGNWWRVSFPVNHQLIADLCGITRESTAIVMKDLNDEHIIRNPKTSQLEINLASLTS